MLGNIRRFAWYFHFALHAISCCTIKSRTNVYACSKRLTNWPHAPKRLTRIHMDEFAIRRNQVEWFRWVLSAIRSARIIGNRWKSYFTCVSYKCVARYRIPALTPASPASPPLPLRFYSSLGNCQFHCNIGVTPFKNSVIYFLIFFIWFFLLDDIYFDMYVRWIQ